MKRESAQTTLDSSPLGMATEENKSAPTSAALPGEAHELRERVERDPSDDAAWEELDEVARSTEHPESVSRVYRDILRRDLPGELLETLGKRAVAFHDEWYEDPEHAIGILQRVLTAVPSAEWAFERLSLLLTMAERWDDLLAVYDAALATCTDREKKKALLDEAARIAKDFAGSTDRAIFYLKQLVPLRPEDAQLASSLERRLTLQKRYRDLIDVWTARLGVLSPAEVLATRVRIAEAWLERLSEAGTALVVVRQVLASEGGEIAAAKLLERIGTHATAPLQTRREALALLKERFAAADRSDDVVRTIALSLDVAELPEERIALRAEATRRLSLAERYAEAVEHAAEWLVLSPVRDVKEQLADLAERAGAHEKYADALVRAASATTDGSVRVEFLTSAGDVRARELDDATGAIALYTQVLDDPDVDDQSLLDVARRLAALLVGEEHEKQRLDVIERLSVLEPEAADRRHALGEAATLAEKLGNTDHALELWRRRLGQDGKDEEALGATVDILEAHERWEALVAALERRHDAITDAARRRADLVRIAEVYRANLGNLPAAIDTFRRVESEFGANVETMDALADLSASAGRWSDVTALLRAAAEQTDDDDRRANHLARMGDVYRLRRDEPVRAVEAYREALDILPAHAGAREGLHALLDDAEAGASAVEALAKAYTSALEWQALLELVERRLKLAVDDAFRRDVLLEAARILENEGFDPSSALSYVRRAFALVREPEIEQELVRLAEETNDFRACADGYAEAVLTAKEPGRRAELLLAHGDILEHRLGDRATALESYARVTELEPSQLIPAVALVRVAGSIGRWDVASNAFVRSAQAREAVDEAIVTTFESLADEGQAWDLAASALDDAIRRGSPLPPPVAHDLKRQLATWQRDRRGDFDAAQEALREAVDYREDPGSLRMLAELERRAPGRELTRTLLRLAAVTDDDLDVLYEAATVSLQSVQDHKLSEPILETLLRIASARFRTALSSEADTDVFSRYALWALERLVQIRMDSNDPRAAVALLEKGAKLPFAPEKSRELRYRAAELSSELVGDTTRAVALCRGILEEAPDDAVTIALLAGLYARDNRRDELLDLRRRELGLHPPLHRRLSLRLDVARVLGELGGGFDERVEALRENLEDAPGEPESVDALASILEAEGRHGELHAELVKQAGLVEASGDSRAAARLWARAGRVAEQALADVDSALTAYRRSVALEPSVDVLDALASIHSARGEHAEAVGWLEKRLQLTSPSDVEVRRAVVLRLSRGYHQGHQEQLARGVLTSALDDDPAATELRGFLAELYREAEDFSLLAPLLAQGVGYAPDAAAKVLLLSQAAHVQRRKLGSLAAAIPLLELAASLAPEDRPVRLSLADALRSAGRLEEASARLEAMLAEFGRRRTPERAAVHYHLAHIARAEGNLDEALAQLEAASSIERTDPNILKLLGDVARQKGDLERAERAYRALLLIVRRQTPAVPGDDVADEPVATSEVMYDLYQMAHEQGQSDRANDLLESAFETASSNNYEALRFERALRAAGQTELVLRVLDTRLERIDDVAATSEILIARADLLAEIGRHGEALDSLLDALDKTPSSLALVASAHDLAVRASALERYVTRILALAARDDTDPGLSSDLYMRAGTTLENEIMDLNRAADAYEHSLATGRRSVRAYTSLLRVVPAQDVERLSRVLVRFVESVDADDADGTARHEALYRLAQIELGSPETRDEGARRLEQALDRSPDYERALSLLNPAVRESPDSDAIARAYERVARALGGDALLLDAIALRARFEDAPVELLRDGVELARNAPHAARLLPFLLERLIAGAKRDGALPDSAWALVDLAAIREQERDFAGALTLLDEAADATSGSESFELRLRVAEMATARLDDIRRAIATYELLLREEPSDARVWKPLLEAYRKIGAFQELEACIARTVDAVYDPRERNHLRMERGRILLEDPSRLPEAETLLREVLDEDPDHVQASVILSELFERTGRIDELNELLERQLTAAKERNDGSAIAALSLRIGKNLENTDRDAAIAIYRDSLETAPTDRGLLEALLSLYGPDDDPRDRAFVRERLLEFETGPAAARLAIELSDIARGLGDEDAAERALRRGYEACPDNAELRDRLIAWYSDRQDYSGLADVLVTDAAQRRNAGEAVEQFRKAARIYRENLSDPGRAAEALARAHALLPERLSLVEELASASADAAHPEQSFAMISDAIARGGLGPVAEARLYVLRAKLRQSVEGRNLASLGASIADIDRALSLVSTDGETELVEYLEMQRLLANEHGDDGVERAATMRLAELLPKTGDQRRGLELLVGWVKRNASDADAVRGLGVFAVNAEKWGAAAKAYQRLVDITEGSDQIDAVIRLSEATERAGVPLEARPALEHVHRKAPGNELVRARLRRMYEAAGAFAELAAIMIVEAEQSGDPDVKFERLKEAGDLSLRVEGGERTAIDAYRRAYMARPDDHRIAIKLSDTLASVGEIEDAANVLDRAIDAFGKRRSPELSELQHAMARVGRTAGDWEAVFAWLDAAVQTDRQNGAAASDLAVVAMERGELDIAIKALQAITLLKGDAPMSKAEAYLRQGIIAEQKGDLKKAVFLAKRGLAQDADYADAKAFLERLGAS